MSADEMANEDEPRIEINVGDSIHWTGKAMSVVSATLPQYIKMLEMAFHPLSDCREVLTYWLRHDTWTEEEGLMLLLGLDPRGTIVGTSNWINAKHERVDEIRQAHFLDGRSIDLPEWCAVFDYLKSHNYQGIDYNLANKAKETLWLLSDTYREMKAVWESGNFPTRNKPEFFVEWANSKGYKVEWSGLLNLKRRHKLGDPDAEDGATITHAESLPDNNQANEPKLIDRNEVIGKFQVEADADKNVKFWDAKLSRPPVWLRLALGPVGKPGESSLWKPLVIAHCLLGGHKWRRNPFMTLKQLDVAIQKGFPEYLDTWKEETLDKR